MRTWFLILGGLLIWAAHFFALYAIGEFAGAGTGARNAIFLVTGLALGLIAIFALRTRRRPASEDIDGWGACVGTGALIVGALAIVWQSIPAFFP